jgi:DNA replication protein DnaC
MTTIDQLAAAYRALRCHHIAGGLPAPLAQAEANELPYLHLAEQRVALERQGRARNRRALNLTKAGFPALKRLEEFDFRHQTTITKRQINPWLDFRFLDERANRVVIGPPGGRQDPSGHRHRAQGRGGRLQGPVHHRTDPGRGPGDRRD